MIPKIRIMAKVHWKILRLLLPVLLMLDIEEFKHPCSGYDGYSNVLVFDYLVMYQALLLASSIYRFAANLTVLSPIVGVVKWMYHL
jgi:hypothetical protein